MSVNSLLPASPKPGSLRVVILALAITSAGCVHLPQNPAPGVPPPNDRATTFAEEVYLDDSNPFDPGRLSVQSCNVEQGELEAPAMLRIHVPQPPGAYAVVLFHHGFMARNSAYDEVLRHLASHGFVVIAPQMYEPGIRALMGNPTVAQEAERAAEVLDWLPAHLHKVTGFSVLTSRLGIAGHSRGAKVAWLLAAADPERARAIAGVDPVDGTGGPRGDQPRAVRGPFIFSIPALILGTELGGRCAPAGDNHVQFYEASQSPAWHIVARNHGHGDMLDETAAVAAAVFCASGPDRAGMRRLTGGLLTALFRAALQDDLSAVEYLTGAHPWPIAVAVEYKEPG